MTIRNFLVLLLIGLSFSKSYSQDLISKLSEASCMCIQTIDIEQDVKEQLKSCVTKALELHKLALVDEYGEDYLTEFGEKLQTNLVSNLLKDCDRLVYLIQNATDQSTEKEELNSGSNGGIYDGFENTKSNKVKLIGFNGGETSFLVLKPWEGWEKIKNNNNHGKVVRIDWTEDYFFNQDSLKFLPTKSIDFIDFNPYPNDQSSITFSGHEKSILTIDVSDDGKNIYSGSNDNTIKIWGMNSEGPLATLVGHDAGIWSIDLSLDNSLLASSGSTDKKILIWDINTGKIINELLGHKYVINTVSLSQLNTLLISGSGDHDDLTSELILWEIPSKQKTILEGHTSPVYAAQFDPKTKYIVSGDKEGKLILWDVKNKTMVKSIQAHEESILGLDISRDGKYIATCSRDQTVKIWSLSKLENLKTLEGHTYIVRDVAFNKKGDKVVSASNDRKLIVWDVKTGKQEARLEGHSSTIFGVKFSHDDRKIISGSWDRTIKVWDLGDD